MSKIADLFRSALARRGLTAEEAREDFEQILARARRRRTLGVVTLAAAAALGAAAVVYLGGVDRGAPGGAAIAPGSATERSIHIYVRRADEPEAEALSLTVNAQGDR